MEWAEIMVGVAGMLVPVLGGIIGIYVKLNADVGKLHQRIKHLEADKDELRTMVKEVVETVHEIRRLLAANRIH
jgi:hypothetical protein